MQKIREIIRNLGFTSPGSAANMARILSSGKLKNTGKLCILPVDQGFEHGPDKSFGFNIPAYSPDYHFELALESGLSAIAAPLGMIESCASIYAGLIPTILKANSANLLRSNSEDYDQALYGGADDAIKLGCCGIGFTIYPGSNAFNSMLEKIRPEIKRAKELGLVVVIWSYPRGKGLGDSKNFETSLDVISYGAHIACMIGADIVKVKPPSLNLRDMSLKCFLSCDSQSTAISKVKRSCFMGKKLVVFSGGGTKDTESLLAEVRSIAEGGGDGSIIGRNAFMRPKLEALRLLEDIVNIYKVASQKEPINLLQKIKKFENV